MKNALLIIDVQSCFLKDAPDNLPEQIFNHQKALNYDLIVFTIFKNTPKSNFVQSLKWDKCMDLKDVSLPKIFQPLISAKNVFERDTYSAFKKTNLDNYLKENNVNRLILCGIDTDACVLATAFEAFDIGYHIKIEDSLTFSGNDLKNEAYKIAHKNLFSRD